MVVSLFYKFNSALIFAHFLFYFLSQDVGWIENSSIPLKRLFPLLLARLLTPHSVGSSGSFMVYDAFTLIFPALSSVSKKKGRTKPTKRAVCHSAIVCMYACVCECMCEQPTVKRK